MKLEKFLKDTSNRRKYRVDKTFLQDVIRVILDYQPTDLWEIFKRSDEYFEGVVAVVENLHDEKLIKVFKNGKFILTPKGKRFANQLIPTKVPKSYKIEYNTSIPSPLQKILKKMNKVYKEVNPKDEFEQGSLRPKAAMKKVAYAIHRGDVAGKHLVCVGDDDLLSLIFGMTGLPKSILVLDIDEDILALVDKYAKNISVPITTKLQDLYKPISPKYRWKYDTFFTQPPDTVLGYTLFISRGVETLKKKPGMIAYGGLTPTGCPRGGLLEIEKINQKMGLLTTDYINKICEYPPLRTEIKKVEVPSYIPYPPNKMWYVSDLVRYKTTKNTKPYYTKVVKKDIADYKVDALKYGK